jgi:serine/threonine protein kinase
METTLPSQVPDPVSLPVGTEVGEWRVVSWAGRGTYGTVYRVVRRGREAEGPYALKLALHPRDKRFEREWELLSRINHPNVPSLEAHDVWEHPAGAFPYLVMQWVAGVPLYEWAAQRNPTSRQVLRLLAQVARALEATSKVEGLHRDVKGDNVLVRLSDERAFLTDFGAGVYRDAATLTLQVLPPGTPNYRCPEAWGYQRLFALHPSAHYRASVCDDLFALGVTAYRLVTDEYPPPTDPELKGSEVWKRGGPGPRPPRELNPNVCEELNALILRLLGQPERRFKGQARLCAEAHEHAADTAGSKADAPLFEWETLEPSSWSREEQSHAKLHGHRLRRRDKATVQRTEQLDAQVKAEAARAKEQVKEPAPAKPPPQPVDSRERVLRWLPWLVPGLGVLALVVGTRREYRYQQPLEEPAEERAEAPDAGTPDGGSSGAAEEVLTAASVPPEIRAAYGSVAVGTLKGPLPGQRKPPCAPGEEAIQGGCWLANPNVKPPCEGGYYQWDGRCYAPLFPPSRQPTSEP